jgi:hypothetical protein
MAYDQTSACAAGKSLNMEMQHDNHDITVKDFKRESSHSADTGWYLRDCCQIGLSIHDFIIFIHIIFISFHIFQFNHASESTSFPYHPIPMAMTAIRRRPGPSEAGGKGGRRGRGFGIFVFSALDDLMDIIFRIAGKKLDWPTKSTMQNGKPSKYRCK